MKLVAIMSLEQDADTLRQLYREHHIKIFSETDIRGYPLQEHHEARDLPWFGRMHNPVYSELTFAFVEPEQADELLDAIVAYNDEHTSDHPIRAFLMPVERAV